MSRGTLDTAMLPSLSHTWLSHPMAGLSRTVLLAKSVNYAVRTPGSKLPGLGSSAFARRYLRNHMLFSLPPVT